MTSNEEKMDLAAELIRQADGLVVAAGAGIGVDSGLPDFRGDEGFWRAYPALKRLGMPFHDIACPDAFAAMPTVAWGFYGHRLALYRHTRPHRGFDILRRWGEATLQGYAAFTSNVDGHFKAAGFDEHAMEECHGSIHHLQCTRPCSQDTWPADDFVPEVDAERCALLNQPPTCPKCGALARPNVLMFGDMQWIAARQQSQRIKLERALSRMERPVVVEVGAGTAIATVRHFSHRIIHEFGGRLVRINPTDHSVPTPRDVGIGLHSLQALEAIDARWQGLVY
ncbi:MAG: NAD-dependent deacetylase [Comamonadaceae bacterium]|nr:NAD-dependent deacetylase [Comamonadaceae bacterium]